VLYLLDIAITKVQTTKVTLNSLKVISNHAIQ